MREKKVSVNEEYLKKERLPKEKTILDKKQNNKFSNV